MKELQYGGETFAVEDRVSDALEHLTVALADAGMAADVVLRLSGGRASVQFALGRDHDSGATKVLHAKTASGEGSHLGLDDI